jgi:hypothetical protein
MIEEPTKMFPCDCMGEGVTVTKWMDDGSIFEEDGEVLVSEDERFRDCKEAPYIQLAFWEFGVCTKKSLRRWWWRVQTAWHVYKNETPYADQVTMKVSTAKNLANHILYVIRKAEKEMKEQENKSRQKPLEPIEKPHPMLCVHHGGSPACEDTNKKYGFTCPKCDVEVNDASKFIERMNIPDFKPFV